MDPIRRVVLPYAVFAGLWILLGPLLAAVLPDPGRGWSGRCSKGSPSCW